MTSFALSQILVGFALCSDILSFQFKNRKHVIICLLISCTLISSHFMLLGHWTAAGLGIVAAIRFAISLFSTSRKLMYLFVGATWITSFVTYEGLLSILGCAGGTLGAIAAFCKEDKKLRQTMFACTCFWIIHNIIAGSPAAVILEIFFASSNIIGYYRYYIRPQKQVLAP